MVRYLGRVTVSHFIREIESSVRAVLEPLRGDEEASGQSKEDSHKAEIKAILKALGIPETDPRKTESFRYC